jgi:hypothetical protein
MMTVSSTVVEYAFYEDNQFYMLSSIYLLNIRRFYIFFYTFTHAGLARKRKKKKEE